MPLRKIMLLVCALAFLNVSCDLEALGPALNVQGDSGFTYSESKALWLQMKQDNGDSYEYTVGVLSWTGDGNNTIITIEDGEAVSRGYQEFFRDPDTGVRTDGFGYSETGAEVGTNEAGAEPLTIDDLYGICIAEYLIVDEAKNTVHFNTDESGILSLCGFVPNGCADDCFVGISLDNFKWL